MFLAKSFQVQLQLPEADYWIGYNDNAKEGSFVWSDGSAGGYENWAEGEPNNIRTEGEDCTEFWASGEWNDEKCSVPRTFICKSSNPSEPCVLNIFVWIFLSLIIFVVIHLVCALAILRYK